MPFADRIDISDLVVPCIIGVGEPERARPQNVCINIALWTDASIAGASDGIADTVDYLTVTEQVTALVAAARRHTVEALATDIARAVCQQLRVQRVRVRVEKPGAVPAARSVGVEIDRTPADFDRT